MKIVIDIPKVIYEIVKETEPRMEPTDFMGIVVNAIANGTILPERYEKLIDVGQCNRELFYQQCGGADSLITVKSAFDMLMSLPTIKSNKEEE